MFLFDRENILALLAAGQARENRFLNFLAEEITLANFKNPEEKEEQYKPDEQCKDHRHK